VLWQMSINVEGHNTPFGVHAECSYNFGEGGGIGWEARRWQVLYMKSKALPLESRSPLWQRYNLLQRIAPSE
jgi:hypothetical protein